MSLPRLYAAVRVPPRDVAEPGALGARSVACAHGCLELHPPVLVQSEVVLRQKAEGVLHYALLRADCRPISMVSVWARSLRSTLAATVTPRIEAPSPRAAWRACATRAYQVVRFARVSGRTQS